MVGRVAHSLVNATRFSSDIVRGISALSLSVSMLGAGSASAVPLLAPRVPDTTLSPVGARTPRASRPSPTLGILISPSLARLVNPYVHYRNGRAILNPSVSRLLTPPEFEEVTTLIVDYNRAPLALKTSGVELPLPGTRTLLSRTTPVEPGLIRTGPSGCSAWDDFQLEGWDGFQWFMNDCYATGLVDDMDLVGTAAAVAGAIAVIAGNGVAAGVAGALSAAAFGAATYVSSAASVCNGQRLWVGLHFWVLPERGCM